MARQNFKPGAFTAPLPPALVTVGDGEISNVLTVAWTGILATVPPKIYISVRPTRYSYGLLRRTGEFVLHLPTEDMARTVDYVGIYTGAKVNKFEACALATLPSLAVAPPTLAACPVAIECRVCEVRPMGSHDVFVADVVNVSCDDRLIDRAGKIHMERAHLLAYAHGDYYALGACLGHFGFSATKPKKKSTKPGTAHPGKRAAVSASARPLPHNSRTHSRPTDKPGEKTPSTTEGKTPNERKRRGGSRR